MQPARSAPRSTYARRPRLVCLGDLTLDVVVAPATALSVGSDTEGTLTFSAGGSAANTARAFAALGGASTFVGAVGDDGWGRRLVRALRAEGVRVHAATVRTPSARLAVLLGKGGERSFVTQRGAADSLRPRHLRPAWFTHADALHVPAYSLLNEPLCSAAWRAINEVRRAGGQISVDLASRVPLLAHGRPAARRMVAAVAPDLLFGNADEARALVGSDSERLLELAPLAVVKEGAIGCRVLWRSEDSAGGEALQLAVATSRLETTDTTGAGDAFDAGFLYSLIEQTAAGGGRRASALRRAAVAGHRCATQWLRRPRPTLEA